MFIGRLFCSSALVRSLFLIVFLHLLSQSPSAQIVSFASATSVAASRFSESYGLAIDAAEVLYVADTRNNRIVKVLSDGSQTVLGTGSLTLSSPHGVAVDNSGNVFIADQGNHRVVRATPDGEASVLDTKNYVLDGPAGLALDASGNLFVSDSATYPSQILKFSASGDVSLVDTGNFTLSYSNGLAIDGKGNLYIADTASSRIVEVTDDGRAFEVNTGELGLTAPMGVAVDRDGNLFIADTYAGHVVEVTTDGHASVISTGNESAYNTYNVAAGSNGMFYMLEHFLDENSGSDQVVKVQTQGADFGAVNICPAVQASPSPCSRTLNVNYTFQAAVNLRIPLLANTDYRTTAGNGCSGSFQSDDKCSMTVTFTPSIPGERKGAIELADNNGNVLNTVYAAGIGTAPSVGFLPGTLSAIDTGSLALVSPSSIAIDEAGNNYVADRSTNQVLMIKAGHANILPTGSLSLAQPGGLAIDGAGTVYIADSGNNRIVKIPQTGVASILSTGSLSLTQPNGLAIDGRGNIYVADTDNNRIVRITQLGSTSMLDTESLTLVQPRGVAVDGTGSIYIADTGNSRIVKIAGGTASVVNTASITLQQPAGLALDAAGTLYVTDISGNQMAQISAYGAITGIDTSLSAQFRPSALAVDAKGNLVIAQTSSGRIFAVDRGTPPGLVFPSTTVGAVSKAQPVVLVNLGNAPLTFNVPSTGTNPSLSSNFAAESSSTCPTAGNSSTASSLAAGNTCFMSISFAPESAGIVSGSLIFTDNAGNTANPGAQQSISLKGAAISEPAAVSIVWTPAPAVPYGTTLSRMLNAAASTQQGSAAAGTFSYTAQATGGSLVTITPGTMLPAGTYALTATFTPSNTADYKTATQTASLTVMPAPLELTANNTTRAYGTQNPPFAGTVTGAVNGDVFTESFTTTAVQVSNAGTYTIVPSASGASLGNYQITVHNGILTINKAASSVALTASDANPAVSGPITLIARVASSSSGAPTGMIQFLDGTTVLGTSPLNAQGTATFQSATLTAGAHVLYAIYSGDQNFTGSQNSIAQQIKSIPFSLSLNAANLTLKRGQSGVLTATLTPGSGYKGNVTFSCSGLPQMTECTFSPASISSNGSSTPITTNLTITTRGPNTGTVALGQVQLPASRTFQAGFFFFPTAVLGTWLFYQRRRLRMAARSLLAILVLFGCIMGTTGCGVTANFGPTGTSTIQVTAVESGGTTVSTTFELEVAQ